MMRTIEAETMRETMAITRDEVAPVAPAGNYSFADFVRIGLPLTLIVMVVSVLMVPWIFPL